MDNYRSQRRHQEGPKKRANIRTTAHLPAPQPETQHLGDKFTSDQPETLHGQLSLLDYLDSYLPPGEDSTGDTAQLPEFD